MREEREWNYADVDGAQAVDLPYLGEDVAMLVVLPPAGEFEAYERDFDGATLSRLVEALEPREGTVRLPRFELVADRPFCFAVRDRPTPCCPSDGLSTRPDGLTAHAEACSSVVARRSPTGSHAKDCCQHQSEQSRRGSRRVRTDNQRRREADEQCGEERTHPPDREYWWSLRAVIQWAWCCFGSEWERTRLAGVGPSVRDSSLRRPRTAGTPCRVRRPSPWPRRASPRRRVRRRPHR